MAPYPFWIRRTDELVNNHREYINSNWWQMRRVQFSGVYKKICGLCGDTHESMNLHHLSYRNKGAERDHELIWLCPGCHLTIHKCRASEVGKANLKRYRYDGKKQYRKRRKKRKKR